MAIKLGDKAEPGASAFLEWSEGMQKKEPLQHIMRTNVKSLLWCSYALFTCIMWGYDGLAGSIVLAIAQFRHDYGTEFQGQFVIPAIWQLAFGGGSLIGLVGGGAVTAVAAKKYGRQVCILTAYIFSIVGVFLQWFSPGNLPMFFGGKVLTGLPLGIFITIAPTYCSEIAPLELRGAVTAGVNWSIVLGQCFAYVVMRQTQYSTGASAYRTIFGVQWIFAAFGLAVLPFFPESPYHLVAQGRLEKARVNIGRLYNSNIDAERMLLTIQTDLENKNRVLQEASFKDCFKGTNKQRTLIAMSSFFVQSFSGINWIIGYMAYFLQLGGMSDARAFDVTVGLSFLMLIGNMFGWVFIERFGRRGTALNGMLGTSAQAKIFLFCTTFLTAIGAIILSASLMMIGIVSVIPSPSAIWVQVIFMAIWSFTYQSTLGAVAWPITTEVSTSSLRGHTQSLATMTNGIAGAISTVFLPFAINPDQGNLGGRVAFIFGGVLTLCCGLIWAYYPETKGRTFGEIDRLFEMGVKPRYFQRTILAPVEEKEDDKVSTAE